ncbi:putative O-glycosylation ligase, exosortase A system-associated [Glaciecola sp. 2405UD65-10]|uniref:putative O-glycosylation ligase, exosortase A system-associated n=1 Tax=Glaciecola sp. 2405UD65-10 TaxID=3397244 RepID=UPI003B59C79B
MRDLLILVILIVALFWTFKRPWIGIMTWNWISLMTPHRMTWGFMFGMPAAAMTFAALFVSLFINNKPNDKMPFYFNFQVVLMVLLLLHCLITTLNAWMPEQAMEQWIAFLKIALLATISTKLIFGPHKIYWYVAIIGLSIGLLGVKGGLFTLSTGGSFRAQGPRTSFLFDNNHFALGLNMVLPFLFVLIKNRMNVGKWNKMYRILLWVTFIMTIICIPFTYSRGGFIGLAIIVLYSAFQSRHRLKFFTFLFVSIIIAIPFLPEKLTNRLDTINTYNEDSSANQRFQAWDIAYNIAKENPITGAGYHYYRVGSAIWLSYASEQREGMYFQQSRAVHSIYFQMMGQHGFVGLALFLTLLISSYFRFLALEKHFKKRKNQLYSDICVAGKLSLTVFSISGALLNAAFFDLFYMIVILSALLHRESKNPSLYENIDINSDGKSEGEEAVQITAKSSK